MNFLLKHLLEFLMSAGTMMFAAGAVAVSAGGDDAGADADAHAAGGDAGDGSGDGVDAGDAGAAGDAGEAAGGEGQSGDKAGKAAEAGDAKLDARTLPASLKSAMAELQKTDPKAHAWLKDRLWAEKRFRDAVPGGLEEVKQLQTTVGGLKELAGPQYANATTDQLVGAIKAEMSEWRAVDAMLDKGDPNVLSTIAEQFPDGFKKLLPLVVTEFASRDLPGYQKWGAGVIHGELQSGNIFGRLAFVDRLLAKNDTEGVKAELAEIKKYLGQYEQIAAKKIEEPAAAATDKTRETELDTREYKIWVNETSGPINREKTAAIKAAVMQYVPKGETLDEETLGALELQVNRFLDPLLQQDPNFSTTFKAFETNRDSEGLKKFIISKIKELLPSKNVAGKSVMGPAERAIKLFFRGAAKPAPKPAAGAPGAKPAVVVPKGWEKIAADKAPAPHDIDRDKTSFEMSFQKAAILKNGKKVFWGDRAPA